MAEGLANDNNTCVVCFKNVVYYSIGECDHPVCFECSTRMRVLCLQNECPICRQGLSKVVFTDSIQPYKNLRNKTFIDRLFESQYNIGFCNDDIKSAYEKLLENRCKKCENIPLFPSFSMLSDHMRKVHERYYCDLCVKHLKIFTSERRCYTRQELAHHRRKGDLDDTSHRGHPLCEFCEERFMDADELYRHLRKEHLYCHLCDADGRNLYYASYSALADHFRNDHYLCEEGECAEENLTAVFRSEIDLKAHKATVHGRGMPRGAARQARTLELQFNITPHPVVQRTPRDRVESGPPQVAAPPAPPRIDTRSDQHFPRLSSASHNTSAAPALMLTPSTRAYKGSDGLARNDRNFPALDAGSSVRPSATPATAPPAPVSSRSSVPIAATIVKNSKPSVSIQLHSQPASASNFRLTQASGSRISHAAPAQKKPPLSDDDFPSLGGVRDDHPSLGAGSTQPPKVTLINSQEMTALKNAQPNKQTKKAQLSSDAFPALSSDATPVTPPQWITVSKSKEKVKPVKVAPPPQPREPSFNPVADFPTLPVNNKAKSKKTAQITPVQTNNQNDKNKKEKKKSMTSRKENELNQYNGVIDGLDNYTATVVNNSTVYDKKIKTVDSSTATTNEKNRNGGNGDFAFTSKDYPPLNPRSANVVPNKQNLNGNLSSNFKPRPACDGMTFTNSSGQTFPAPVHSYIPPNDFEQRNRALVKKFTAALESTDALENFKVASRAFRDSIISADEFYQHCKAAMGSQLENMFPELVALLPDIAKQQELVVGRNTLQLEVCSTCGQLLSQNDRIAHDAAHWPPLVPH